MAISELPAPAETVSLSRRHLSSGRASLGEMFGGHLEAASHGAVVTTHEGREFLNCAGYGVLLLGSTHPRVVDAVVHQVRTHPVSSRILPDTAAPLAAEALVRVAPDGLTKVHFTGSGAEATECAIKLARAQGKRRLVTTVNGYHGKTMGALSVTARHLYQEPFEPLLPDVTEVPFGDAQALERALEGAPPSCFLVEPVQGEGGVIVPPAGYLQEVARLCRAHDCFLVVDEVLTGLGRLGHWWASQSEGPVHCDALLVGKGLSGGVVPVSAVLATPEAYKPFDKDPFIHTSTFSGAPIAMAAARAAIEALQEEDAVGRAAQLGELIRPAIAQSARRHCGHLVTEVRGQGLLIGLEMRDAGLAGEVMLELLEERVLVNHSLNNSQVLRLTPAATLTVPQTDWLLEAFDRALAVVGQRFPA
ncbi:aspartate aminotransferase family protein [Nocardiopsis sp. L17-MgMaSL7]|uniref:aspartate aminotransferase family protein n=1 Tax=Nocardiopsis sp. L17-MgMaSL7 TaxID=1938893 RepID=UPI000D85F44B|nr:aminotransferase class III-fold pyridoxal phosphate-dependent enzyme [Nocardiopsis sp. L17-MgMaSL7]PWV58094.1 putrescine aminotransferase [Nocardiopsis sp. L17-MgMaSL7]